MEKLNLSKIASEAGVSKTTVSRALNNCFPVDPQTKEKVLAIARKYEYETKHMARKGFQLGIILPVNPSGIFKEIAAGMEAARNAHTGGKSVTAVYAYYSCFGAQEEFLGCLARLVEKESDVFLIAAPSGARCIAALQKLSEEHPVFLIGEGPYEGEQNRCVFLGADAFAEGARLGERAAHGQKGHCRVVSVLPSYAGECARMQKRREGFWASFRRLVPAAVDGGVLYEDPASKIAASSLARKLQTKLYEDIDLLYVEEGLLPAADLALIKLRRSKTVCVGFGSMQPEDTRRIVASSIPDCRQLGEISMGLALKYLRGGEIHPGPYFVPSTIFCKGEKEMKKIRIGVFGARRGRTMIQMLAQYPDAELVAICDRYEPFLEECRKLLKESGTSVTLYTDFEEFFLHDMDAVVLANYASEHVPYAIRFLRSGRHVASEVLPAKTMAEAVALVGAVEESGKVYAYLENYCYFPATMEMRRLYREGKLGEFHHGEGEYIHNCGPIWPEITYGDPNHWRNNMSASFYSTHSFGPLVHITGLRPVRVIGVENNPAPHMLKVGYAGSECAMEIIEMENGATVKSIHGNLVREPSAVWYSVYGESGMAESNRWEGGIKHIHTYDAEEDKHADYDPEPVQTSDLAKNISSHGGSDFYTVHYFIQKILGREEGKESIGIYEALDMGIPGLLAYQSIQQGNIPLAVPNFRNPEEREAYRNDQASSLSADSDRTPITSKEGFKVPEGAYEEVEKLWQAKQNEKG